MRSIAIAALLAGTVCSTQAAAQSPDPLTGEWLVKRDASDNPTRYHRIAFKVENGTVTGTFASGRTLEGTLQGTVLHFTSREGQSTIECTATLSGGAMSGTFIETTMNTPRTIEESTITASRWPPPHTGPPRRHDFAPTRFAREFSAATPPVLHIWPGDTVHTTTLDAYGDDEHGVRRSVGANLQTGPFFVETASPGDTLAVHFVHIRLNRDYARSSDDMADRAVDPAMAVKMKDVGQAVRWHLDRERMVATSERPGEHLKVLSVPLRPMLGCVATAPPSSMPALTNDSGVFGGNMDFNEIVEGATVYLPINAFGALLYIGDGHAAQGDGELNWGALETSLDVEFTVDVIPNRYPPSPARDAARLRTPRVESDSEMMTVGLGGSLDDALREAVSGMSQWLEQDYGLTPSEIAQVLGTSLRLTVNEVADRNAGIAARLSKQLLKTVAKKR